MKHNISLWQVWPCDWERHIKDALQMPPLRYGKWNRIQEPSVDNQWTVVFEQIPHVYNISDLRSLFSEYMATDDCRERETHQNCATVHDLMVNPQRYYGASKEKGDARDADLKFGFKSFLDWLEKKEH